MPFLLRPPSAFFVFAKTRRFLPFFCVSKIAVWHINHSTLSPLKLHELFECCWSNFRHQ